MMESSPKSNIYAIANIKRQIHIATKMGNLYAKMLCIVKCGPGVVVHTYNLGYPTQKQNKTQSSCSGGRGRRTIVQGKPRLKQENLSKKIN
jgi:hypothetical protein